MIPASKATKSRGPREIEPASRTQGQVCILPGSPPKEERPRAWEAQVRVRKHVPRAADAAEGLGSASRWHHVVNTLGGDAVF